MLQTIVQLDKDKSTIGTQSVIIGFQKNLESDAYKLLSFFVPAGEKSNTWETGWMDQQGEDGRPLRRHHSPAQVQAGGRLWVERAPV